MAASELAKRLHDALASYGYQWMIGGTLQTPTDEDLDKAIDKAKATLYAEPVPSQLEVGRLVVRHHTHGKFEVYLLIGESND